MSTPISLRHSRAGASSFYGAFAVVIVSALVIGTVLRSSTALERPSSTDEGLADLYLATLLKSSVANGTSLEQALAGACLAAHCPVGAWNASALSKATDALAAPLAGALERHYAVQVTHESLTFFTVGDRPAHTRGEVGRAEVFHARDGAFLEVAAVLSRL